MDLLDKAESTLSSCLSIKRSERVLVLCDTKTLEIGNVFFEAAHRLSREAALVMVPLGTHHGSEPPELVAQMMARSDVIIAPTTYSITYTNATRQATNKGARVTTMPGMTMEMLEKGGLDADYPKLSRSIERFGSRFRRAKKLRITSKGGTDLSMSIEKREWITGDTGLCHRRGSITNLPAGKVFIAPLEKTVNGKLVFDGAFIGPEVQESTLIVRDGMVVEMDGSKEAREQLFSSKCARTVCEVGIGMNPSSRIIGNILEDQKARGTVHIGFGDNSTFGGDIECPMHNDGMVLKPTLAIDEETVIEKGEFLLVI